MALHRGVALALAFALLATPARADLITNGGFEAGGGSFTGWTTQDQSNGSGSWSIQSGTGSPLNGFTVPPPPEGTHAAMTDQFSPGSHVLFQDFLVPTGVTSATLSFQRFISNHNAAFFSPDSLDFNVTPNQQARVDIMTSTSDPFSVAAGDVLENIFQTMPGDPRVSGYTLDSTDVTALLAAHGGETLRLRFAETDNQDNFNFGVDAVSLNAAFATTVPEPASVALLGLGVSGLVLGARRRKSG